MTEAEQIAKLNAVVHAFRAEFIDRPELEPIRDDLRMLITRDNTVSEGGVLTLLGVSGSGKTQFIQDFIADYPRERHAIVKDGKRNDRVTVVVVAVTDTGIKDLSKEIYLALAQAEPPVESRADILKAVYHYADQMETKLIIFEEAHDASADRTGLMVAAVARLFKQIANRATFSILIVGTPDAGALVSSNKELKRRNFGFHTLHPISWDDPPSRRFLIKLLNTWDKLLAPALGLSGLGGQLAVKIVKSSGGIIGLAALLVERAGITAVVDKVRRGGTCITETHFFTAHNLLLFETDNPFVPAPGTPLPPVPPEPKPVKPTGRKGGRQAARDKDFRP